MIRQANIDQYSQEALQPQELVLDLLGWYVRPAGGHVWSGGLVRLLGELGFSTPATRIALGRLVRRGLLAPAKDGRLVHYDFTPRLETLLAEGTRRIDSFALDEPWDGLWTVLWYAIPEEQKAAGRRLAPRLRFHGFGSPQEGSLHATGKTMSRASSPTSASTATWRWWSGRRPRPPTPAR